MARIGMIAMSAKPLHRGHWNLITTAAKECERVRVFASLTDRDNVKGSAMRSIWGIVIPHLPENVTIVSLVSQTVSPVRRIYEELGDEDKREVHEDVFVLYGDPHDLEDAFPEKSLRKYLPRLTSGNLVVTRPITRGETDGISGTQMREWLRSGDKESFVANLPDCLDGNNVWDLLKA